MPRTARSTQAPTRVRFRKRTSTGATRSCSASGPESTFAALCPAPPWAEQGINTYPYGNTFLTSSCVDSTNSPSSPQPAGSFATCIGDTPPFDQVFDMSGNAAEWEYSCAGINGANDQCLARGGSYRDNNGAALACAGMQLFTRDTTAAFVGFRCCVE
jgi:hypothetical protein